MCELLHPHIEISVQKVAAEGKSEMASGSLTKVILELENLVQKVVNKENTEVLCILYFKESVLSLWVSTYFKTNFFSVFTHRTFFNCNRIRLDNKRTRRSYEIQEDPGSWTRSHESRSADGQQPAHRSYSAKGRPAEGAGGMACKLL